MLKTDYKNDAFTGDRKYNMVNNSDGTVSLQDVTAYTVEGDVFGAKDINETNEAVNGLTEGLNNVNVYVSSDGKLHYVDKDGADTELPFSNGKDIVSIYEGEIANNTKINRQATSNIQISIPISGERDFIILKSYWSTNFRNDGVTIVSGAKYLLQSAYKFSAVVNNLIIIGGLTGGNVVLNWKIFNTRTDWDGGWASHHYYTEAKIGKR